MLRSLVGSEMCIRDSGSRLQPGRHRAAQKSSNIDQEAVFAMAAAGRETPVSYTHLTLPTIYSV